MNYKTIIRIFFLYTYMLNLSYASWYDVKNYEGYVGKEKIFLSMQLYEFSQNISITGTVYNKTTRLSYPIIGNKLENIINICESRIKAPLGSIFNFPEEKNVCDIKLLVNNNQIKGVWNGLNVDLEISNQFSNDLNIKTETHFIPIVFWGQTNNHLFEGLYYQSNGEEFIDKINIINKKNGNIDQIINLQNNETCQFGFYTTPIYMNIENGPDQDSVILHCYSQDDNFIEYKYHQKSGKYILDER